MPTVESLQFDGHLTSIALQYNNPEFIGDLVLPPIAVPRKQGKYKIYNKPDRFTVPDTTVGPKSQPNEVDFGVSEGTFACADEGLQEFVSNEEIDNAESPITPLADAVENTTALMMLAKEIDIATAVHTAANYATTLDLNGSWATLTNDILAQIVTAMDACFMPPNVMVMGLPTWRAVSRNEKVLAAVKGTLMPQNLNKGKLSMPWVNQEELAQFLGLDAVLVGRAKKNTAAEGQTPAYGVVWDGTNATKGGAAFLRVKTAAVKDVVWGAQFSWKGVQVMTRESARGAFGGQEIRVVESRIIKSVSTDVGYLFIDALVT